MYQALYRKWRPRSFDDVVGQEHITETLKRQVIGGKLSHAYLFTGTRGTGKTTCAKILSKVVNCESPENGNPCNRCPSCIGIDNGSIMDVTEMDAASNNGVENVRDLREEAVYLPSAVKKRVYIIDEVHMLSGSAFNALLKILEEPPEHLLFILATTELHKVPATILSRCQKYSFKRISPAVIAQRLSYIASQEELELTDEASAILARLADGSMRDALSLLDQCSGSTFIDIQHVLSCIGLAENDEICRMLDDIIIGNSFSALERLTNLYIAGKDVGTVLNQLAALHRDILLKKLAPKGSDGLLSGAFIDEEIAVFSKSLSTSRLLINLETLQSALSDLDRSIDRKTAAEICLLRLVDLKLGAAEEQTIYCNEPISEGITQPVVKKEQPKIEAKDPCIPKQEQGDLENTPESPTFTPVTGSPGQQRSWPELLKLLSKKMDPLIYSIMEDSTHSEGEISDNTITIGVKSPFSLDLLDTQEVKAAVKAAAESIWDGVFSVTIREDEPNESETKSKLEKLSRFDNVKFE